MPAIAALATTAVVLVASLVTIGVVIGAEGTTYWAAGYGALSMNLNALVNPMRPRSLLPTLRLAYPEQYEGYAYLGVGILALLAVGLLRRPSSIARLGDRRLLPLAGLVLVCTALAASTIVTLGPRTLLTLPEPPVVKSLLHGLRASGRLFWPAYYLIVAAAFALTARGWSPRTAAIILTVALAVQMVDLGPKHKRIRETLDQRWDSRLRSPAWKGLGRQYDNLILVPPYQCGPEEGAGGVYSYVWFGKFAAAERMRTNDYYAARYTKSQLNAHCVDLLRAQLQGTLDARSAYVVSDAVRTLWSLNGMHSHHCTRLDGFNLCTPAEGANGSSVETAAPPAPRYVPGQVLDLADTAVRRYLTLGWGPRVTAGTWTQGPLALARLGLDASPERPLILEIEAEPQVADRHPRLDVDVAVNGQAIDRWIFEAPSTVTRRVARIPPSLAAARRGLDIELRIGNPESPRYAGTGPFDAFLGLNVHSIVVRQE